MARLMGILSSLVNIYMLIIFIRIALTWFRGAGFSGAGNGGLQDILAKITDPYLNWFRRFPVFRTAFIDFSPIAALGVLSLFNHIFGILARYRTISVGIILALALQIIWGAASFFLGFLIVILILRLIAHFTNRDAYSPFWRIINSISTPVLFRINRVFFRNRILTHVTAIVLSIISLGVCYFLLNIAVSFVTKLLVNLPV